jgi:exonuclease SbcC
VRLGAEAAAQTKALQSTLSAAGTPTLGALRASAGAARSDEAHAGDELARVTAAAARATQIDTILEVAGPFLASLDALTRLLADGKFVGHLVREREVALLAEASRVLRSLSGDRFGFGPGFKVIDRHSGQERGPDTLSGGERFQASLALALALVEIATRSGGQLEAVFVDEGFGSLDAGSLDQALTTLGAVASDGKLVALVSHLRQVAEYVDQVLLVERDDATGSHVRALDLTERDALLAEDARSRMTG